MVDKPKRRRLNKKVAKRVITTKQVEYTLADTVEFCPIAGCFGRGSREIPINLFTSEFYYLQNEEEDENGNSRKDIINKCKAFLFLHTLQYHYDRMGSFFTNTNFKEKNKPNEVRGGVDILPYGYVLLLGALIWRRRYMDEKGSDPIIYHGKQQKVFNQEVYTYKVNPVSKDMTFLESCYWSQGGTEYYDTFLSVDPTVRYSDLINTDLNKFIEDELVEMFTQFAEVDFVYKVAKYCELKLKIVDNRTMTKDPLVIKPLTWAYFKAFMQLTKYTVNMDKITDDSLNGVIYFLRKFTGAERFYSQKGFEEADNYNETIEYYITNTEYYNFAFRQAAATVRGINSFFKHENNPFQQYFFEIFEGLVMVCTIPTVCKTNSVSKENLKLFYTGVKEYLTDKFNIPEIVENENSDDGKLKRDLNCELYLNFKNIWDRWLSFYYNTDTIDDLRVNQYFKNKFVFIDSFYNNLYDTIKLNCNELLKEFIGNVSDQTKLGKTTVAHLGNIASQHRCMMFNFPDNFNFTQTYDNQDNKDTREYINELFLPVAYNHKDKIEAFNKFVIIYTHSADKLETVDKTKFNNDSFDIWSYNDGTEVAPDIFKNGDDTNEPIAPESKLPYKIPSFGVAYSRQNNSYWKNINVSMDNFSVTEQAIKTESIIAQKGNDDKANVVFYGQDLYSMYQSYSYLVTIEMLGDAQIQPLMYFQLMNIPMFRGTYMIIRVEHRITQGDMTTTFTGMKMSRVQAPYTSEWFIIPDNVDDGTDKDESDDNIEVINAADGDTIDLCDNDISQKINNVININENTENFIEFINTVDSRYDIKEGPVEDGLLDKSKYEIKKLNTKATRDNKWGPLFDTGLSPVVGDVLFGYTNGVTTGNPTHGAIYLGIHHGYIYVAEGMSMSNGNEQYKDENVTGFSEYCHVVKIGNSHFESITHFAHHKEMNIVQCVHFTETFDYGEAGDALFNYTANPGGSGTYNYSTYDYQNSRCHVPSGMDGGCIMPEHHGQLVENPDLSKYKDKWNKYGKRLMEFLIVEGFDTTVYKGGSAQKMHVKLNPVQAAAMLGVWDYESGWNPLAKNNGGGDYGVPQWMYSRKFENWYKWFNDNEHYPKTGLGLSDHNEYKEERYSGKDEVIVKGTKYCTKANNVYTVHTADNSIVVKEYYKNNPGVKLYKYGAENMTTIEQQIAYIKYEFRPGGYYSNNHLFGDNPARTIHVSGKYNLCGNLMYEKWANLTTYDEGALCDMVYRFMVCYEGHMAPYHPKQFAYTARCNNAKIAFNLWKNYRNGM